MTYSKLITRNSGYISNETQDRIRNTVLLIAGCGIGSQAAIAAARTGFCRFILCDGDTVSLDNLNRQAFLRSDVGVNKAEALKNGILAINPEAEVEVIPSHLTLQNTESLVKKSDLIFDTIDFLDLEAIVHLHDCALKHEKHLVSCVAVGWGAAALSFPPEPRKQAWIRDLFKVPSDPSAPLPSYQDAFADFFSGIAPHIDPQVTQVFMTVIHSLSEGKPCPAPQVAAGAYAVASLAVTMASRILSGQQVIKAPELILVDVQGTTHRAGISVAESVAKVGNREEKKKLAS